MHRDFIATTGDGEISIVVEPPDGGGLWRVTIDGRVHWVDARPIYPSSPGTWSLLVEGRSYVIDIDKRKAGATVIAGTREIGVEVEDARRKQLARAVAGHGAGAATGEVICAPIAGKVVKVAVTVAQEVAAGSRVAVLEAMKMENEIKAERGGTVSAVHVQAGQSVETGERLVTLS
jgi:oxaloacetate decarboxylase alpha subunit